MKETSQQQNWPVSSETERYICGKPSGRFQLWIWLFSPAVVVKAFFCPYPAISDTLTLSPRPQPPALPHQRCGGDALPDGGGHNGHDVAESRAHRPGSGALLPGDRGGTPPRPLPQPQHHWNFQRLVAVETLPQILSEDAVRAHFSAIYGWACKGKAVFFISVLTADISDLFFWKVL